MSDLQSVPSSRTRSQSLQGRLSVFWVPRPEWDGVFFDLDWSFPELPRPGETVEISSHETGSADFVVTEIHYRLANEPYEVTHSLHLEVQTTDIHKSRHPQQVWDVLDASLNINNLTPLSATDLEHEPWPGA